MASQPLMLTYCYFVLILVVLPMFCSDKVYSAFYQADSKANEEYDALKAEHRRKGVLNYLENLVAEESLSFHEEKHNEFVDNLIVIMAKNPSRKDDLVLSQLVTELDRNIRHEIHYRNAMIICNSSRVPFNEIATLSTFYPVRQAQNTSSWKMFNREEIIKHDFADCLTMGVNHTQAKHITIIRDVVVPYSGFLEHLNNVLSTQVTNVLMRGELYERESSWLFMHLHEPVPFRHYMFSLNCIKELFLIATCGSVTFYLAFHLLEGKQRASFPTCSSIFFGALYFVTFAMIIGRPYVTELRRMGGALYRVYDPYEPIHFSAMSLPVSSVNEILLHLNQLRCSSYAPFHEVLDHMVNTLEKPGFVISPTLFRYVTKV